MRTGLGHVEVVSPGCMSAWMIFQSAWGEERESTEERGREFMLSGFT